MSKKIAIGVAVICGILIVGAGILLSKSTSQPVENSTTNTVGNTSIRNQIMATKDYYANQNTVSATNTANLENLEKYNKEEHSNFVAFKGEKGISFIYPKSWTKIETEKQPVFTDGKGAMVQIYYDLMSEESTGTTDFDAFMALEKIYLVKTTDLISNVNEKIVNLNGRKAYILNYVTEVEESGVKIQLNATQVACADEENNVYILTMTALDQLYNEVKGDFDKIIKSFIKQ